MNKIWKEIREEVSNISPLIGNSLNAAADKQEIEELENTIGQKLPQSFIEYLKTYNGQNHNNFCITFLGYNCLLTVSEIVELWNMQIEFFGDEEKIDIQENKVQAKIWDKSWIPFAYYMNKYLIIDLNPGKNGTYGQVFQVWSGRDLNEDDIVVANSFEDFSQHLLNSLKSNDYTYGEDEVIEFKDKWII